MSSRIPTTLTTLGLCLVLGLPRGIHAAELGELRVTPTATAPRVVEEPNSISWDSVPDYRAKVATDTYVDIPCEVYLPGKADPQQWMSTSTLARVTYDGFTYQYGYDPMAQTYDLLVSGLAQSGYVIQETVGVAAAEIPAELVAGQILRVEIWFAVLSDNLFPQEGVGITGMDRDLAPNSSLDAIDMQRLYDDARGFTGTIYLVDHFSAGAHAIDLGQTAAQDFSDRIGGSGWFGIGFAADGWDLSGSSGTTVFWKMAGGGGLPATDHPFFRVYYNAAPLDFALASPAADAVLSETQPTLSWEAAVDPNGDSPLTYRVRLGSDPSLGSAVEFDAATSNSVRTPFPLVPGTYYWQVVASDPGGAQRDSEVRSFEVVAPTAAPGLAASLALRAVPNPFNPRTTLRFHLARSGSVRLEILDARGRHVRSLWTGTLDAGAQEIRWDGQDDAGRACASGAYFARLSGSWGSEVKRLALVR